MMNTQQLAAPFLGVAIFDTAQLAARSFITNVLVLITILHVPANGNP
jgi:hypothetical protein